MFQFLYRFSTSGESQEFTIGKATRCGSVGVSRKSQYFCTYAQEPHQPCLSLGSPGFPGNHRGSSQNDSLLKCRALEELVSLCCSGLGKHSQLYIAVLTLQPQTGTGNSGAQLLNVPCHRNNLSTSMALADLTWFRSGSLLGSTLVGVEHCRRASLSYSCFHSVLNTRVKLLMCLLTEKVTEVVDTGEITTAYRITEQHILGPAASGTFLLLMEIFPVFLEASHLIKVLCMEAIASSKLG